MASLFHKIVLQKRGGGAKLIPPILTGIAWWFLQGVGMLASFVTSGAFPQPLSPEEEQELLFKMVEGDEGARNILIERNLRLVAHIVKKFDNTGEDSEDLISIGVIGLIKAINTFNPEKNTRLATYAARCIENEILMHLRTTKRIRQEVLLYDPIGADREGNEISLMDILSSDRNEVEEIVVLNLDRSQLAQKFACLSRRERTVIELRFGLGQQERHTQRQIGKLLGISRSYVSRIEKRALGKLLEQMSSP